MTINRRRLLIAVAGLATLVLVLAGRGGKEPALAAHAEPKGASTQHPARVARSEAFERLPRRRAIGEQRGELFATRSWAPPPPPPPPASAQAEAAPPPNPYRFAGTVVHDGKFRAFVADGDRVFEAREGEELERGYRVESVSREAIVLSYIPLGTRHQIEVSTLLAAPGEPPQRVARGMEPGAGGSTGR